jgi:hypothetical protein
MHDEDRTEPGRTGPLPRHRRKALLLGLALLAIVPAAWQVRQHAQHAPRTASTAMTATSGATDANPADARHAQSGPADFRQDTPSPDARLLANWALATRDNGTHAMIIVDKKAARAYVLTPDGHLKDSAPVLLGAAKGDDIVPGSEHKTPAQMRPDEKTTPAGRFLAKPAVNAEKEDIIWIDYDDAISMHRVRTKVPREHRLERLATLTSDDNRISFGCINLPTTFYEDVVTPAVKQDGAVIYVLPEVKTVQEVFGAWDVTDPAQVAARRASPATAHTG